MFPVTKIILHLTFCFILHQSAQLIPLSFLSGHSKVEGIKISSHTELNCPTSAFSLTYEEDTEDLPYVTIVII